MLGLKLNHVDKKGHQMLTMMRSHDNAGYLYHRWSCNMIAADGLTNLAPSYQQQPRWLECFGNDAMYRQGNMPWYLTDLSIYRQFSNISRTWSSNINVSRLVLQLSLLNLYWSHALSWEWRLVGAAPTGDAPTTSEWSTILLSGVPDYFGRNKISSGGDLSHYSSASLY